MMGMQLSLGPAPQSRPLNYYLVASTLIGKKKLKSI